MLFKSYVTVEFFVCVGMRVYVTLRYQLPFIFTVVPLKIFAETFKKNNFLEGINPVNNDRERERF